MADNAALLAVYTKLEQKIAAIDVRQGGPMGPQGPGGIQGEKGPRGDKGSTGPQGPKGHTGPQGRDGTKGSTGPVGASGKDGKQGPVGSQGPQGNNGPMGPVGPQGDRGTDGVSVVDANIDFDGNLTMYLSDGTELDAGKIGVDGDGTTVYTSSGGLPDYWKNLVEDHINDFNNPHHTTLENLDDTTILNPVEGHGLWYDETTGRWVNRAAFLESWPTGLANGGELNIAPLLGPAINPATLLDYPTQVNVDTITEDTLVSSGGAGQCRDSAVFTPGLTYQVTYDISAEVSQGRLVNGTGGGDPDIITRVEPGTRISDSVQYLATAAGLQVRANGAASTIVTHALAIQEVGEDGIEVIAGVGLTIDAYTNPLAPPTFLALQWGQINEPITVAPAVAGSIVWFSIFDTGIAGLPIGNVPANLGGLKQYATAPDPTLAREEIFLGFAVHNGVEWQEVSNPKVINQTAETLREYITNVQQLSTIISGGAVTEIPAFELDQEAGVVWENNRNWHVDKSNPNREALPAASPIVFEYVTQDFSFAGGPTSTIDPTTYDVAGTPVTVPGPANTATIQRLYIDPANNYWVLYGQEVYPDYATANANLLAYNPVVPFLLQNSIYLGAAIVEKAKTDWDIDEAVFIPANNAGTGGSTGGTPITTYLGLNDTPASYGGHLRKVETVADDELSLIHDYRNRYIADYTDGPTYYPQEWVSNPSYIAICNALTTDPAFPTIVGDVRSIYPDLPPFSQTNHVGQVRSGYLTTFKQAGEITIIEVWVAEVSVDTHYTLVTVGDPNGTPNSTRYPLANEGLAAGAWNPVTVGSSIVGVGTEILIYLESHNYGAATQVTGGWTNGGQQNTAAPLTSAWNFNNANTLVRIDKTDLNSTDRTTELLGIITGSTLLFAETATPTINKTYVTLGPAVDQGTYIEYPVSLTGSVGLMTIGVPNTLTADVPVAQATQFVFESGKFTPQPEAADFVSFLEYDDVTQAVPADIGYGINFDFQQLEQSPDWNLIPVGGGGGGGGGDFTPSTFMGAGTTGYVPDPITESGRVLSDNGSWIVGGGGGGGQVNAVVGGTAITVDATDPTNPIVNNDAFLGTGTIGYVPDPGPEVGEFLRDDGVWAQASNWNVNGDKIYNSNTGNVGVGTSDPLRKLVVNGTGTETLSVERDATSVMTMGGDASFNTFLDSKVGDMSLRAIGAKVIKFFTNTVERMRITADGFVGIGTGDPANELHVNGLMRTSKVDSNGGLNIAYNTSTPTTIADETPLGTVNFQGNMTPSDPTANRRGAYMTAYTEGVWTEATEYPANLRFYTVDVGSTTTLERMRITADGSVGLGTEAPEQALHVIGNIKGQSTGAVASNILSTFDPASVPGAGQVMGNLLFQGSSDGISGAGTVARIRVKSSSAWGVGDTSTEMSFATTPVGSSSQVDRLKIRPDGIVTGLWSDNSVSNPAAQFVSLTQAEYDALTPNANTIYFVTA